MSPLRIGFVVHVMQVAGAEVLVRETIRRLGDQIVPTVFCLDNVGTIGEELVAEGVDLVCLDRRPGRDYRVSWRLAKEARRRKIDILHAHQYSPFFYAALAKPLLWPRTPRLILTEHGRHYPDVVSPKRRAFNRLVLDRFADSVNACCQFSATALSERDGFARGRIEVIANGIEVERYGPALDQSSLKQSLGFDPARRYLIHVARHHPVKDQATLLKGFAQTIDRLPEVDLLLVGDGPLRPDLEKLAGDLGIWKRVKFLGIRRDIPELLKAADAFALTSVSEAASLTLLEAMATGLPCIASDVGGNPELVRHEQEGLLFPRGDGAALAAAITRTFTDSPSAKTRGENARQRAQTHFRVEQTIDSYHRLYRRLMGR